MYVRLLQIQKKKQETNHSINTSLSYWSTQKKNIKQKDKHLARQIERDCKNAFREALFFAFFSRTSRNDAVFPLFCACPIEKNYVDDVEKVERIATQWRIHHPIIIKESIRQSVGIILRFFLLVSVSENELIMCLRYVILRNSKLCRCSTSIKVRCVRFVLQLLSKSPPPCPHPRFFTARMIIAFRIPWIDNNVNNVCV